MSRLEGSILSRTVGSGVWSMGVEAQVRLGSR